MGTVLAFTSNIGTPALWIGFSVFVLVMLALDLGVFHRKAHAVSVREAFGWSVFWISLGLAFNGLVYFDCGRQAGLEFLTGYIIEKALSVDNIFVFLVILTYFSVPAAYQHRVLFYGILGALAMRALFIFVGTSLMAAFHWMIYVFGAILVYTAIKLLVQEEDEFDPAESLVFRLFRRVVPAIGEYRGPRFIVREGGRWLATPLLMVLVVIEATDVMFALDSIPAILAVTTDPFIVYTSNIFAILGLRALYFLLAGAISQMHYLRAGLSMVLGFVGVKMLLADVIEIPISISLTVVASLLAIAVIASLIRAKRIARAPAPAPSDAGPPEEEDQ